MSQGVSGVSQLFARWHSDATFCSQYSSNLLLIIDLLISDLRYTVYYIALVQGGLKQLRSRVWCAVFLASSRLVFIDGC